MIEEIKSFEERKEELIKKGKEKGFITYEELATGLKGLDVDSDSLDELYNSLIESSIEIVNDESEVGGNTDEDFGGDDASINGQGITIGVVCGVDAYLAGKRDVPVGAYLQRVIPIGDLRSSWRLINGATEGQSVVGEVDGKGGSFAGPCLDIPIACGIDVESGGAAGIETGCSLRICAETVASALEV